MGDHIRKRRLDLKLFQKDVAKLFHTDTDTIGNWEMNRCQPGFKYYPAIMDFLGYCPWVYLPAWGERLNRYRIHQGLSLKQFAQKLEVDPGTLSRQLTRNPSAYFIRKFANYTNILSSYANFSSICI